MAFHQGGQGIETVKEKMGIDLAPQGLIAENQLLLPQFLLPLQGLPPLEIEEEDGSAEETQSGSSQKILPLLFEK